NDIVGYGLPGMAVNKDGDIAVVYGRTSSKLFMETRFSTWLHNEGDIRPSRILQSGQAGISAQHPDTAGVALDPFDNQAIWMAHEFASSSGPRIAVGKVFGKAHPNLVIATASATNKPKFHPGDHITVNFTMANQGDGTAPGANAEAFLVLGQHDISLGKTAAADLKSGHSVTSQILGTIPKSTGAGDYAIQVRAKLKSGTTEYRDDDNTLKAGGASID
ncbi:MAG TPA: CARDB domain-containing protein, partial [Chthoniobacterales bacterium]